MVEGASYVGQKKGHLFMLFESKDPSVGEESKEVLYTALFSKSPLRVAIRI